MADARCDYSPIADYGAIGNLRTVALVSLDGSVDWWCPPVLSNPSVFGAILDRRKGGRFRVAPRHAHRRSQRYVGDTNVLKTILDDGGGRLTITDFMPLAGDLNGLAESEAESKIARLLKADGAGVEVEVEWSPRFDYARIAPRMHRSDGGVVAEADVGLVMALGGLPPGAEVAVVDDHGPTFRARFHLDGSRPVTLVTRWGSDRTEVDADAEADSLGRTIEAWRSWAHDQEAAGRGWAGSWAPQILRSELTLKMLTYAETGALAAAATTSLPETIGGVRNWDYRYAWIRDASMIAQAMVAVGHSSMMREFLSWAERVAERASNGQPRIQVLYGLHGERDLPEGELGHLEGCCDSRPVRFGNEGTDQRQHDMFSDLLCGAYELSRKENLEPRIWRFLEVTTDLIVDLWDEPDHGIWEVRTGPHPFVFSRVKLWQALNRSVHFARKGLIRGDVGRWRRIQDEIRTQVLSRGYDRDLDAFVMSYDKRTLDAANLQIPVMEFLPPEDPRVRATIDRTMEQLTDRGLVYRYKVDDGLPGEEGAFVLCTFWLVDALALSGRLDEAYAIFEGVAGRANHLGLFSEQIDPKSGRFLGNFPQAFSHIGLINSVLYIAHAEGKDLPVTSLVGTPEHRAELGVDPRGLGPARRRPPQTD